MSRQTQNSMLLVGVLAAGIAFVAFLVLLVIGGAGFNVSFFGALVVGLIAAVILFRGFHSTLEPAKGAGQAPTVKSGGSSAAKREEKSSAPEKNAASDESATVSEAASKAMDAVTPAADAAKKAASEAVDTVKSKVADATPEREAAPVEPETSEHDTAERDYDGDGVVEGKDEGTKPEALDGPRGGKADDLKKIKGVGPKLETLLNRMGFYHFDQVAAWTDQEVAWVDANLEGFKGRVTRDEWVSQAKLLASGGETTFSKKVDKGDVY